MIAQLISNIFYRRNVEHTFVVFSRSDHIKRVHNYINSIHQCLKFTYDIDKDETLSFIGSKVNVC